MLNVRSVKVIYPANFIMQYIKSFLHTYLSGLMPYAYIFSLGTGTSLFQWFLYDRSMTSLTRKKREKAQITNLKNERGVIATYLA